MAKKPQKVDYSAEDMARARSGRTVALVLVGATLLWLLAQVLGPRFGLPGEYAILFDLAALAAFFWAMVVAFRLWRMRGD
ncbi:MAG: DUF5337 domain-containing protein [Pseudomonadota bacterium]